MKNIMTPVIRHLEESGVEYRIIQHNGPVLSLEQAARERDQLPSQVVRSIVFRLAEDTFLMVLMPGPGQVPWKQLRRYLNQTRLTMASEEELLAATGFRPGTVTPFGLPRPMRILVDQGVLDQPEISLGSGQRGTAIIMRPENLLEALDQYEIVNFSGEAA